eukprot:scaffold19757_cov113-Isochrysis_galbana.AAC.6
MLKRVGHQNGKETRITPRVPQITASRGDGCRREHSRVPIPPPLKWSVAATWVSWPVCGSSS